MTPVLIRNGHVIDPASQLDAPRDILIRDGKINAITQPGDLSPPKQSQTIDAKGQIICPGLVDLRNRVREPGLSRKGTIASETYAAVSGGVTSLCCPPDTLPVIDSTAVIKQIRLLTQNNGYCRVYPMAAMTKNLDGQELSEMYQLVQSGCVGVSNALKPIENTLVLRRIFEYAVSYDIKVFLHPMDKWLGANGCAHEGMVSARMGLGGIPESAETIALLRDLELVRMTGVHAHICGISSARGVEIIRQAKAEGLPITADVCAHQLHLTEMDIDCFNSQTHVLPPLRTLRDQQALQQGLLDNTLDAIVSDHQPHNADAKLAPFAETEPGISAVETFLPLAMKTARHIGMSHLDILDKLCYQPAKIAGLDAGRIKVGSSADICIFNPRQHWLVEQELLHSKGKNTPFQGWELFDRVSHTLVQGQVVFQLAL